GAALPDGRRVAADAEELAGGAPDVAELRRHHDPVAAAPERLADELFVAPLAVHVGRVEEVAAGVEVAVDDADRLLVVLLPGVVEVTHPHAAQADRRHPQAARPQLTLGHDRLSRLPIPPGHGPSLPLRKRE